METQTIEPQKNSVIDSGINKFFKITRLMLRIEPIMANIIAIALAIIVLVLLNHPDLFPKLGKYHLYFVYIMYGLIVFQTMKSATKSLLIPLISIAVAAVGITMLNFNPTWNHIISIAWFKKLMLLGVVGIAVSVFSIR